MKHKSLIFLLFGIIILVIMLWFIGINEIINALKIADLWIILAAILIQVFTYYLYTLRWEIINGLADIDAGIKKLLPMTLVGLAINNITPSGRGGGEPVRAYILSRDINKPMEQTFAAVIADRALDTFPFVILAIITIIAVTIYFSLDPLIIAIMVFAVIVIIVVLCLLVYMCINKNFGDKITNWIIGLVHRFSKKDPEKMEKKVIEVVAGFQDTMKLLLSNKNILYYALPLSFIIWIFEIFRVYLVFLAFGANISPIVIGEVFIMASLVGMIPLLPGGLGAVDGIMILFYSAAGASPSISAAATVIERLISFWLATIIGLAIMPYYGSSILDNISINFNSEKDSEKCSDDRKQIEYDSDDSKEN